MDQEHIKAQPRRGKGGKPRGQHSNLPPIRVSVHGLTDAEKVAILMVVRALRAANAKAGK